jgi:glycine/D-amino acid oxidase-like deaminating enzyme
VRDSIWLRTLGDADRAVLDASDEAPASADIVVVGAGPVGLATAYYLVEAGVGNVCVIDRGDLLGEAGGANAGGLWFAHQSVAKGSAAAIPLLTESAALYDELEDRFPFDRTYSGLLELIENQDAHGIATGRAVAARRAGFEAEILDLAELRDLEPGLSGPYVGGLLFPDDGQVHPAKLAAGWIRRIREAGGKVCAHTEALRLGPPVLTAAGNIETQCVVVACGAWTPLVTQAMGWTPPIRPVRGTLLALPQMPSGTIRTAVIGPRYYWWQLPSGEIAGGGSEELAAFDRAPDDAILTDIRADLALRFPDLASQPTLCSWTGFRPHCADLLPVIGSVPGRDEVFVSAGHFRMGVMTATGSGLALAQLIVDGETEIDIEAMRPERFTLSQV